MLSIGNWLVVIGIWAFVGGVVYLLLALEYGWFE
jgi:hypothetical protein